MDRNENFFMMDDWVLKISNVMNGNISPAKLKLPLTENYNSDQPVKKSARLSSEGEDVGSSKTEVAADLENMEVDEDIDQPNRKSKLSDATTIFKNSVLAF